ncbi:hypothetical protein TNCV_631921 [Trichonephila clavipes]|nr:hypothetical protein TNCV_631921 [Trichonephila clavipes]
MVYTRFSDIELLPHFASSKRKFCVVVSDAPGSSPMKFIVYWLSSSNFSKRRSVYYSTGEKIQQAEGSGRNCKKHATNYVGREDLQDGFQEDLN